MHLRLRARARAREQTHRQHRQHPALHALCALRALSVAAWRARKAEIERMIIALKKKLLGKTAFVGTHLCSIAHHSCITDYSRYIYAPIPAKELLYHMYRCNEELR